MGDDIKLFNLYAKGRCRDKFLAMKHVCGLSDLQYDILVEKWCSGRVGMTRSEMADKHNVSERTLDREYADAREKIMKKINEHNQDGFKGPYFFKLDEELNGADWSKYTKSETQNDLAIYLGFKKPEDK